MICQNCANWNLKQSEEMAKLHFGQCIKMPIGQYSGKSKPCDRAAFIPLAADLLEKRRAYFGK